MFDALRLRIGDMGHRARAWRERLPPRDVLVRRTLLAVIGILVSAFVWVLWTESISRR